MFFAAPRPPVANVLPPPSRWYIGGNYHDSLHIRSLFDAFQRCNLARPILPCNNYTHFPESVIWTPHFRPN